MQDVLVVLLVIRVLIWVVGGEEKSLGFELSAV